MFVESDASRKFCYQSEINGEEDICANYKIHVRTNYKLPSEGDTYLILIHLYDSPLLEFSFDITRKEYPTVELAYM